MRVLVVEDERKTASFIRSALEAEHIAVDVRHNGPEALAKPFVLAELVARLRALVRRGNEPKLQLLRVADLTLDTLTRQARRGETTFDLAAREYRLLEFLMRSAGRVCGRTT